MKVEANCSLRQLYNWEVRWINTKFYETLASPSEHTELNNWLIHQKDNVRNNEPAIDGVDQPFNEYFLPVNARNFGSSFAGSDLVPCAPMTKE